jgi:protein pelota
MKVIHSDLRHGEMKLKTETLDDLWYLSQVVEPGDIVRGRTLRKIKAAGGRDDDTRPAERKAVFLSVAVEKVEFHKYASMLRIGGQVSEGIEDVPKGSYHTFDVGQDTVITVIKEHWLKFQLERIREASSEKQPSIMICILDREQVLFAALKKYGYEMLSEFSGEVEKKVYGTLQGRQGDFYHEIAGLLERYDQKYRFDNIIVASPAFWKDELLKKMPDSPLRKKIHTATCSSVTPNAIEEVLRRDEVKHVLRQDRIARETALVGELFLAISSRGMAAYGISEVMAAVEAGAVKELLVTDSLIQSSREKGSYGALEKAMRQAESMQAKVTIVSSENDAGKKLDGLGGIGAILRYRLNYGQE